MRFRNAYRNLPMVALALLMATIPFSLNAKGSQTELRQRAEPGALFLPSEDAMDDLKVTLKLAQSQQKLALVILGADWCHDSRALARRLQTEPLKSLIDENYAILLVDIGNLTEGRDVMQHFGIPIYYATPTVLVIDPVSGQLVDNGNRNMWGNAASVSMDDSVAYFRAIADIDPSTLTTAKNYSAEQIQLMAEIDAFEQIQADRLAQAYLITGAMLEGDFDQAVWQEVGKYRNSVAADVAALRAEVKQRIASGETGIVLAYPDYPPWSWSTQTLTDDKL